MSLYRTFYPPWVIPPFFTPPVCSKNTITYERNFLDRAGARWQDRRCVWETHLAESYLNTVVS
jgi:hypothetical protein